MARSGVARNSSSGSTREGTPDAARPAPSSVVSSEPDRESWVRALTWAALAVWLAIPILGLTEQPLAGRIVWTMAVASLPLFIVLVGYHRWRRICPLAFFNQIPVKLGRPGTRRASAALEQHYYFIPFTMFFIGLWLRLIWTNGDGMAIALFFVGVSLVALLVGVLFTGKTWCNYICPVSFIEKIYTEPRGLRDTQNSQCTKCTACKKACPDINQENGYWKEIDMPSKRFVYFAYPGLVFGFYFYYFLQAGTWDYYFGGSWTDEAGVILRAFLPGVDAQSAGFFFLPAIPRALAAALTLAACAVVSLVTFTLAEIPVGRWLRQRDPTVDAARIRHVMFGVAAFAAFVIFYSFAGQPTLRKLPWLPAYTGVLVVLVASTFLLRRLTRTQQAFAEQSIAKNIIKRWTWADIAPPANLHDAYVIHTARTTERERMYADVLEVYQDAIREVLAEGIVTRAEVQRLESLRDQLQIKKADHERIMAALAQEERVLLTDPTKQASTEKRLQLETYSWALERQLDRVVAADIHPEDGFIEKLRAEFGVSPEEHVAVLNQLLDRDQNTGLHVAQATRLILLSTHLIGLLSGQPTPTADTLVDFLQRKRSRAVDRLLRTLGFAAAEPTTAVLHEGLCSDSPAAALPQIAMQLRSSTRQHLEQGIEEVTREAAVVVTASDAFATCTSDTDPFVRAVALYGLAERGAASAETLRRLTDDAYPLVRETAVALLERQAAGPESHPAGSMLSIEKMIALRRVPVFGSLAPDALEELARSCEDHDYAPGEALCIKGEMGKEVFVVLSGEFRIIDGPNLAGEVIGTETAGAVIGEMAVLDAAPRSASAFAGSGGGRALRLAGGAFRRVLDLDPAVADGVIRALARRLRGHRQEALARS